MKLHLSVKTSLTLVIFSVSFALLGRFVWVENGWKGGLLRTEDRGKVVTTQGDFKSLEGFWLGDLLGDLRIMHRITSDGQVFLYSLDQGGAPLQASQTTFDENSRKLWLWFPTIGGTYQATLDESNNTMKGKWKQGRNMPLEMKRFDPTEENKQVPREFRVLLDKAVSGDPEKLVQMAGFWSGYLSDVDGDTNFVSIQIEKMAEDLVEPKLFLLDDQPWAYPIRTFEIGPNGESKIVLDGKVNAIFRGQLSEDGKQLAGAVYYDDTDRTPPLELVWSEHRPTFQTEAEPTPEIFEISVD